VNNGFDAFDDRARTLTRGLIKAAEQDPTRSFEPVGRSFVRSGAVLLTTAVAVAGVILVGTGALHLQLSNGPVKHSPPPVATQLSSPTPGPTVSPTPSISADSITNLRMFSTTTGWAQRQSDGSVLHTTRGAGEWSVDSPAAGNTQVIATAFVDAETARALTAAVGLGEDGVETIQSWSTSDGGQRWTKEGTITSYADALAATGSLDFSDSEHGWLSVTGLAAAGSTAILIYRTVDAGAHWEAVDLSNLVPPPAPGKLPSGCDKNPAVFLNASTGWVTAECNGGAPFLYVTRDGGVSWRAQSLGVAGTEYGYTTAAPQFVNGSDGFMFGFVGLASPPADLFVTTDGGSTWSKRLTPGYFPQASEFIDPEDGWLLLNPDATASSVPDLWVTHNAGRTWTDLHTGPNLTGANELDFVTPELGWAFASPATSPPTLLQTTDGGRTWTPVNASISG
jgi:photosystem II stability/assembly factor-like uncharacterized protein